MENPPPFIASKEMMEKIYTSQELADKFGCARITVLKWAEKNNVRSIGKGNGKVYLFTEKDIARFKPRKGPGRPKTK